jgi:hypothetical protein
MTDAGDSEEPLQQLPAGLPRRYAEYKPVREAAPAPPLVNVGGYDELVAHFHSTGIELPRSKDGLAAVDHLIESASDRAPLAKLVRAIGMFYGDILTHTVSGAHWEVVVEGRPCVRITRNTAVSVVSVAERRLTVGTPTLLQNYAHVLEIVASEP